MENNRIGNTGFKKLIGKWITEGEILAADQNSEMKIAGTDLRADTRRIFHIAQGRRAYGKRHSQTIEIIGLDERNSQAILDHYKNHGSSGKMTGTLKAMHLK